jgi:ketosteroid isomerase-like protein
MTTAEKRELQELVERYAQAVDRADGGAVAALVTEDGVLALFMDPATGETTGERRGRADIAKAVDGISRYAATHHTISSHSSHVERVGATGETLCAAHHVSDEDGKRSDRVHYIRYLDTYARPGAVWHISRREVHVQWTSTLPVD